jgi:hypothetical protein
MATDNQAASGTSLGGMDPRACDWGLYRTSYERDSCGFGLIASLDDQASHWVLETAISSLNRLTHRGAIASDGKTGDGCGLLIKQPTAFLRAVAKESGFDLAPLFAAGLVFLNRDAGKAALGRKVLTEELQQERLIVAGFRQLPTDPSACGEEALKTLPTIEQIFVCAGSDLDEAAFNRKLFLARRRAEKKLEGDDPSFYLPSLSASTIVYKGMVMPQYLVQFYPDLRDPPLWSCSTSASPRTRCRSGGSRIRIAILRTMARSTRCRATAVGRWHAVLYCARRCCRTSRTSCRWFLSADPIRSRSTTCWNCCSSGDWTRCMPCVC